MNINLSRRKFFMAGGATVLAPAMLAGDRLALADTDLFVRSDRELSVIVGKDAGFGEAVEAFFPGLMHDPVFQEIAPLALLLTHKRGPGIRAQCISWSISNANGTYTTPLFSYVSPGSPATGHSPSTLCSARQDILSAGQCRLVTPFFSWTPTYYQSIQSLDWKVILRSAGPGAFLVSQLSTATDVDVALDAAVFSDWKVIGPDEHHLSRRLRARRHAEHDEGMRVHKLLQTGATDAVIVKALHSHAVKPRSSKSKDPWRWYFQARIYHAQILLRHFQNADRDTFAKAVARLTWEPRTEIKRLDA